MAEEETRNPVQRVVSDIRSSGGGAGEPSSSAASSSVAVATGDETAAAAEEEHWCCICKKAFKTQKALCGHMRTHPRSWKGVKPPPAAAAPPTEQQGRDVRESAAAGQSIIHVQESVPISQRAEDVDVDPRRVESLVNPLMRLVEWSLQRPQGDDGGSGENNITSHNSTARGGGGGGGGNGEVLMKDGFNEPANISVVVAAGAEAGVGADANIPAGNGTVPDVKNGTSSKKMGSSSSSSSAAGGGGGGGIGAHACDKCGRTFATGQSLGGHMRKHYDGPLIINKKRTREQRDETPAPTVERRVRTASSAAPSESHNPALLSRSVQANNNNGGDCERNGDEPERPSSAGDGARCLHNFIALLEKKGPESAPQPEPERKDDDGDGDDDDLLSLRLGRR